MEFNKKDNLIQLGFEGVGAKGSMYIAHSTRSQNNVCYSMSVHLKA